MVCMRCVFMHGGLSRQMDGSAIMRWAAMKPRSVRESDAEQQNHLQDRGGSDKDIAKALHRRGQNTRGPLFRQRDWTIFGLRPRGLNPSCKRRSEQGDAPARDD